MITSTSPLMADWFAQARAVELIAAAERHRLIRIARRKPTSGTDRSELR